MSRHSSSFVYVYMIRVAPTAMGMTVYMMPVIQDTGEVTSTRSSGCTPQRRLLQRVKR